MATAASFPTHPSIRLGVVGVGKIARDRHLPALAADKRFEIAASASRAGRIDGLPSFADVASMLKSVPDLQAVSLCLPPSARAEAARLALDAGLHVMLEKPPGMTLSEVADLEARAEARGLALFAAWHSREASAVSAARDWLASRRVTGARVAWLENVRIWHPGQQWIWEPGGFGVFDPGINALSILTHVLPGSLVMRAATLDFPANCQTPIRAALALDLDGAPVEVRFDFDHRGKARWDIEIETESGRLELTEGGERLAIDGVPVFVPAGDEYARLYARFAALIEERCSEVDTAPLQLIADAFLCARRTPVEPFEW